jgi:hypothetical protein
VSVAQGLLPVGPTESGELWRVDKPYSGRFLIRDSEGAAEHRTDARNDHRRGRPPVRRTAPSSSPTPPTASPHVSTARQLPTPKKADETWVSEFDLPASGGTVEISLNSPLYPVGVVIGWVLGSA